jgi:hypothetical protein
METTLQEIERALDAQLYYPAVVMALTLPDICAALESPEGKTSGRQYRDWYNRYLASAYPELTDVDCYSLRCGVVHEGRFGHSNGRIASVTFIPMPMRGLVYSYNCRTDEFHLLLGAENFCRTVIEKVRQWMSEKKSDPTVQSNLSRLVRYHPGGLPPNMSGAPVFDARDFRRMDSEVQELRQSH